MKTLTDKQQKWIAAILLVVIPFLIVHLFSSSTTARLISILWISVLFPVGLLLLILFTKQPVRLRNYSNPVVEKRLEFGIKVLGFIFAVIWIWYMAVPALVGTYKVYVLNQPFTIVNDSVGNISSTVLAPGLYFGISLKSQTNNKYAYLFPTVFRFDDNKFKFTILPGTKFILNVERE